MFSLFRNPVLDRATYEAGGAHVHLTKAAGDPVKTYGLSGRLTFSKRGWLLLSVPNALGRGAFDALNEPGIELPVSETTGLYNAHISVCRPEEIAQIGGPDKITERGHEFYYTLGPIKSVTPDGWNDISKVWFIEVDSPDLRNLRKSYGLSPLPNEGKYQFHITVAVRRKKVLLDNDIAKAASWEERNEAARIKAQSSFLPHVRDGYVICNCGARYYEMPDDSKCPSCSQKMFRARGRVNRSKEAMEDAGPDLAVCPSCDSIIWDSSAETCDGCGASRSGTKEAADRPVRADAKDPADCENCPHCDTPMERGDDGYCNRCGEPWPAKTAAERLLQLAGPQSPLDVLRAAKAESDRRNYAAKHALMRKLIAASPADFAIDSDDGRGILGVTHGPTGFQMHLPVNVVGGQIARVR